MAEHTGMMRGVITLLDERHGEIAIEAAYGVSAEARRLRDCLPKDRPVDCIVSSLPLLFLSEEMRDEIIRSMLDVLREGGLLIQYTYSWRKANAFLKDGFRCVGSSQIWHNVPPARVFRFRRERDASRSARA